VIPSQALMGNGHLGCLARGSRFLRTNWRLVYPGADVAWLYTPHGGRSQVVVVRYYEVKISLKGLERLGTKPITLSSPTDSNMFSEGRTLLLCCRCSFLSSTAPARLSLSLSSHSEGGWPSRQSSSQSFLASAPPLPSPRFGCSSLSLTRIRPLVLSCYTRATMLSSENSPLSSPRTSVSWPSLLTSFPAQRHCLRTKGTPTTSCSLTVFFSSPRLFDGSL
jgi:hypothetical protein